MLLAVDSDGLQRWATPQAYTLLGRAGVQEKSAEQLFGEQLKNWLKNSPKEGYVLHIDNPGYRLSIKLVSVRDSEWVLRLVDGEKPTGAELLKLKLNVTERESEVMYWIANGKTNRETADILNMSPRTVNKHLEQIYAKLEVDNRTSAAGIALKTLAQEEALA
jgi:DNA-binding CsgD family transcriptional regulator